MSTPAPESKGSGEPPSDDTPFLGELPRGTRSPGSLKGRIYLAPDFDDDDEIADLFERSELFPDANA